MEFSVKSGNPEKQRSACVVVGIFDSRRLSNAAKQIDDASDGYLSNIIRRGDIEGKADQSLLLQNVPGTLADRILLIGCGKERNLDDSRFSKIVARTAKTLEQTGAMEAVTYLTELNIKGMDTYAKCSRLVEATRGALYHFDRMKSKAKEPRRPLRRMVLSVASRRDLTDGEQAVRDGQAISEGVSLARNLGNLPGNICTPSYIAESARELGSHYPNMDVTVLEESDMEALGMGSLLSVSRGSKEPAKLISIEYRGGDADEQPIVLVGKGVTFDSGGISIKPGQAMDEMKFDMCGAASVLGTLTAAAELQLPINVTGVIPTTENMPGGNASKPGDIVTTMSGQTVEILNTDAEGRLILCDALTWCEKFNPKVVIDIATLTGACVIALGSHATGLLSNHHPLTSDLLHAGTDSGDRAWELPLWPEYMKALDSNFADMANIGNREAGTITAAGFLSRFTRKYHWAHLDIAGTAWNSGKAKGATGRPVPMLSRYLINQCNSR